MSIFGVGHSKFLNTTQLTAPNVPARANPLTVGTTYTIVDKISSDDFLNVGAAANEDGETFVATGTTPTAWTDSSVLHETVLLEHSKLYPSYAEPDEIIHKSVIDGTVSVVTKGDYVSFRVIVHLNKYNDPAAKFSEIFAFNHSDVYFYPHEDGSAVGDDLGKAISDSATWTDSSSFVTFHITKIKPFYLEYDKTIGTIDALEIEFVSKKYVDIENTVQ